jgi:nucleoside-diphosphate-sugar epimerase
MHTNHSISITPHKILILGATGFVGSHVFEDLSNVFETYGSSRNANDTNQIQFDITKENTWSSIIEIEPSVIINCIGYGVVKNELDIKQMIDINYLQTVKLFDFIFSKLPNTFLIHIGTAFEYNLNQTKLTENSICCPQTYYGISKLMASHFLLSKNDLFNFTILRPFSMFGPYEHESKIIPYLINAQKNKLAIPLSSGTQQRDYFFVKDLSNFIKTIINKPYNSIPHLLNIGSGKTYSLIDLGKAIATLLPEYNEEFWQWGEIPSRLGESDAFYNASNLAFDNGFKLSPLSHGIEQTLNYYLKNV